MKPDNRQALKEMVRLVEQRHGGGGALKEAVRWSLQDEITRLLDSGVPVDVRVPPNQVTPLMLANNPAIAKLLIDRGADVNAKDKDGRTALIWFLRGLYKPKQAKTYVQTLLRLGADVSLVSESGESAILLAECKYGEEIVALLRTEQR